MTTPGHAQVPERSGNRTQTLALGLLLCLAPGLPAAAVGANESFQTTTLFHPSPAQLGAEARGRVMIYDGLDNEVVERALDEQFDRIEHMMFTRTRQRPTDSEDDAIVEDDGC